MTCRHFLSLLDLTPDELHGVLQQAARLKNQHAEGEASDSLHNRSLAMIFDKSSTRTRVSFEAGMTQLGGSSMFLSPADTQLGRGEPIEDTARVISRMVDVIVIRTHQHEKVETFAVHSQVPVINALTDKYHPCQLLADIQTFIEHRGDIRGRQIAWIGDGNNVCHSWMNAARQFDFTLKIACPEGYEPDQELLAASDGRVQLLRDPHAATADADAIVTDTWASMGQEQEKQVRQQVFADYCVDNTLMQQAKPDALFMHCLPAYRGAEVTADVIDGPQSVVWDEAENRLHAQKALLEFLLT